MTCRTPVLVYVTSRSVLRPVHRTASQGGRGRERRRPCTPKRLAAAAEHHTAEIDLTLGVFVVAALVSLLLIFLQRRGALSTDALLGILSHSTLALGLVIVAFMSWIRIDLMGFLFGDILAVSRTDIAVIYAGGLAVLCVVAWLWRPLLAATVSAELAEAEGLRPGRARLVFMLVMAFVIAIAMKLVGILLITSLLIIPAATARRFSSTPEQMALAASLIGALAVTGGLYGSLTFDTPSGPSIVVAALICFIASLAPIGARTIEGRTE